MFFYKITFEDNEIKEGTTKFPQNVLTELMGKFKRIKAFECYKEELMIKKTEQKELKNERRTVKKRVK